MRPEVGHAPSTRGRRRKHHAQSHGIAVENAVRASLLRPAGVPGANANKRPLYNSVFSSEHDDDIADALVDPLDSVTSRDLASARYAQNHEYIERIFGPKRLDLLDLPPTPYYGLDASQLKKQLEEAQQATEEARSAHQRHVAELSAGPTELPAEDDPEWAKAPSAGRVIGIGFVPSDTPQSVAEVLRREALRKEEIARVQPSESLVQQTAAAIHDINAQHNAKQETASREAGQLLGQGGILPGQGAQLPSQIPGQLPSQIPHPGQGIQPPGIPGHPS